MATIIDEINQAGGAAAGGYTTRYTTVTAWEAGASALGTDIYKGEITDNLEYTESVILDPGGTGSATSYLWLTVASANRHSGVAGTGHARMRSTSGHVLQVNHDYTRIEWLEIHQDSTGASDEGVRVTNEVENLLVSHCIIWSDQTTGTDQDGIYLTDTAATTTESFSVDNCIIYGFTRSQIHIQKFLGADPSTVTLNVDHCTLINNNGVLSSTVEDGAIHVRSTNASDNITVNVYNTIGYTEESTHQAFTDGQNARGIPIGTVTWNGSHNLRGIQSGETEIDGTNNLTNSQFATSGISDATQTSGSYVVVQDLTAGSENFLLLDAAAGNLAPDNGTDRQGSEPDTRQDFSVDITGGTRPTTNVDIGAHEFIAAGSTASLFATGDGTIANVVDETDGTTAIWESIDDDPASPNDTDWVNNATASPGSTFADITDAPIDLGTMSTAEIVVRTRGQKFGTGTVTLYAQLFQSDESTSLSDEVQVDAVTVDAGSFTNETAVTFTGLNTTAGKAVWDAAKVRFRWATETLVGVYSDTYSDTY